ncbi:uncharacterized protein [Temnothorax nylanderi]|uniref:uncharacterized protein n=1 Tax=Temnothorax nylanderi TaxID=102681 RepID=UPI003A84916E
MTKIKKYFSSKRHLRRIVKKDLIQILQINRDIIQTNNHTKNLIQNKNFYDDVSANIVTDDNVDGAHHASQDNSSADNLLESVEYIENIDEDIYKDESSLFKERCDTFPAVVDDFINTVQQWILKYRHLLSQCAINELLTILRVPFPQFPQDSRTILQTPTSCPYEIITVYPGFYCHLGIENGLRRILNSSCIIEKLFMDCTEIVLPICINIDGLPISKSSSSQFWPILIYIDLHTISEKWRKPFAVGIYHGLKKPADVHQFMNSFINEFQNLEKNGFQINNRCIKVKVSKVLCDAPAKSFLLCIKGHTGYSSCTKCTEEGTFINGKVVFVKINGQLRNDSSFRNKLDEEFHKGVSPLEKLNMGLVSQVPLDGMHLVYLGVVKRILMFLIRGNKNIRLSESDKKKVNDELLLFRNYLPTDFARLPRSLEEIEYYKATELRQFLLYTGPVALQNIANKNVYIHFMALSCAIRILSSSELYLTYNNYALQLLEYFVKKYEIIYGTEYLTHNVHGLIHLPADCVKHGPLENFSCFKFENYLFEIKKKMKMSRHPLQQICNRLKEQEQVQQVQDVTKYPVLRKQYRVQIHNKKKYTYFKEIDTERYELKISDRDNCVILKDKSIVCITDICQKNDTSEIFLKGNKFTQSKLFFNSPCSSQLFHIQYCQNLAINNVYTINIDEILMKCIKYPYNNGFIILPIIHSQCVNKN